MLILSGTKFSIENLVKVGVYIRWNGMVEWNSGMDYWNGGMLRRTYLTCCTVPHHWKYQSLLWLPTEVL